MTIDPAYCRCRPDTEHLSHRLVTFRYIFLCALHTRMAVRECYKGDDASQWGTENLTNRHAKIP